MQRGVAGKNERKGGVGLAVHSDWPGPTDRVKFSGFGLNQTKVRPDSAPGQIWDQFFKSFEGKKSKKPCISVQHRYVLST